MSNVPTAPPQVPLLRRRRHGLLVCLFACALVLVGAAAGWLWYRARLPQPPVVNTSGREPEVVAAVAEAREKVVRQPRSGAAWGHLGMVLLAHHFQAEAGGCLTEAGRLDPREPRWPYLEGRLVQQRDPEAALPLLRRAAALAGKAEVPRVYLAESLLDLGHTDEAAAGFRALLDDAPGSARAQLGMSRLAYQQGDLDASELHARAAAAAAPSLRAPHVVLAEICRRRRDIPTEERELALAGNGEDPKWPDPYMKEVSDLTAGSEARFVEARRLIKEGRRPEAAGLLAGIVRTHPDDFESRKLLGGTLLEQGDLPGAEAQLQEALRLEPDSLDALSLMGAVLQGREKYRDATACYQKMIDLKPGHALARYNLAVCRERLGDRAGAADSLRDALRCKPDFLAAHKRLGRLLADLHQDAEAARHLQDALRLAPDDAEANELLAQVRARLPRPATGTEK